MSGKNSLQPDEVALLESNDSCVVGFNSTRVAGGATVSLNFVFIIKIGKGKIYNFSA